MNILTFIQTQLRENVGKWPEISEATGVPYPTLAKIGQGETENPRIKTAQAILDYFNTKMASKSKKSRVIN